MTKDQARAAIVAALRARKLTKPMTPVGMLTFCQEMHGHLQFRSRDPMQDIRGWAERWQAMWLRDT
jgi:hypothetical protein